MSRDYPIIGPRGGIQLEGVVRDGEFHLVIGRADEPGAAELLAAITALVDAANVHDDHGPAGPGPDKLAVWGRLHTAVDALHLAGRVAA